MTKVFLDTNSVNIRENIYLDRINQLYEGNIIDIWVSDAFDADVLGGILNSEDNLPENKRESALKRIEKSKRYSKAHGALMLDSPTLGLLDECALDCIGKEEIIQTILFPKVAQMNDNQLLDVRHLSVAEANKCSFFITQDNDFLNKKEAIFKELTIKVIHPKDFCIIFS